MWHGLVVLPLLLGADASLPDKSLAEVRSELEATLASMPAISVRYTLLHEPDPDKVSDQNYPWGPRTMSWAKDGERVLVGSAFDKSGNGDVPGIVVSFDGEKAFHLDRTTGNPEVRIITELHESYWTKDKPDTLVGLAIPNAKPSLPEAMRLPNAALTGQESIGGTMCYRVEVRRVERRVGDIPVRLTAWLDPTHDMLPRRVSTVYETDGPRFAKQPDMKQVFEKAIFTWETEDFVRVRNPLRASRECWFPKRASSRIRDGWLRLNIKEVAVRESLPSGFFRPPMTTGTTVWDLAAGKIGGTIIGGPQALPKQVRATVGQVAALKAKGPPRPADARPLQATSWAWVTFCVSTACLAMAGVAWWRLRSS